MFGEKEKLKKAGENERKEKKTREGGNLVRIYINGGKRLLNN